MIAVAVASLALIAAAVPALVFWRNLGYYRPPVEATEHAPGLVSVLVPARNEERSIAACMTSILASKNVELEALVLDDHSTDATAEIVRQLALSDARLRLHSAPALSAGWCGKQFACSQLARLARGEWLVFVDADVRFAPDAVARLVAFAKRQNAALVSGIPRQETVTLLERLLIPLIHFLLLGFLPLWRMRASRHPAYAAACGQLMVARRDEYERAGGHSQIRGSLHDGLTLPRAFREAGCATDLCDATELATCRMYRSAGEVWRGLSKNATEGLAAPAIIVPATVLLVAGQVLPAVLLVWCALIGLPKLAFTFAVIGTILAFLPRVVGLVQFRQSLLGAALHPLAIVLLLLVQWSALVRQWRGRPAAWKDRVYAPN